MSYIKPVSDLGELEPAVQNVYRHFGFVPNTIYTMAHRPAVVRGFLALAGSIVTENLSPQLRFMVAQMASTAAGCRYCQSHAAMMGNRVGTDPEKIAALWAFETDKHFSPAERAALRLARDGAVQPNAITAEHFEQASHYFDEGQLVEIVAIISLFGFLNRWNDTLATQLEEAPLVFAGQHLRASGWTPDKHIAGEEFI